MKAIEVRGAYNVVYGNITTLDPGHGEVLVRVRGTEVEIVEGTMPYFTMGIAQFPVIPGHEWSGEGVVIVPRVWRGTIINAPIGRKRGSAICGKRGRS